MSSQLLKETFFTNQTMVNKFSAFVTFTFLDIFFKAKSSMLSIFYLFIVVRTVGETYNAHCVSPLD